MDPWEKQVTEEMASLGSRMEILPSDVLLHIFEQLSSDYQQWIAHFRSEEEDDIEERFHRCEKDYDEDLNDEFDVWRHDYIDDLDTPSLNNRRDTY